jgi:hypothetical protein
VQAWFEILNVHRPIDLATGLYHPGLAGNRLEIYDDLMVGLGLAQECHRARHPRHLGAVYVRRDPGMLRELEYDAEVDRRRT